MSYLTLTEAAEYTSRVKGFTVEPATLLRAGIHGGLRIAAPFDSLMRNLTAHANEDYLGLLFLNPADGDLYRIESYGQATIKKAYGLDGVSIYAPFVVQTLAQLRVMVSDLDKFLPLLESLDTPQTAPAQQAETVEFAPVVEVPDPERRLADLRNGGWITAHIATHRNRFLTRRVPNEAMRQPTQGLQQIPAQFLRSRFAPRHPA